MPLSTRVHRMIAVALTIGVVCAAPGVAAAQGGVAQRLADLEAQVAALQAALSAETAARIAAVTALQANISAEASAREAADSTLQGNIRPVIAGFVTLDGIARIGHGYTVTRTAVGNYELAFPPGTFTVVPNPDRWVAPVPLVNSNFTPQPASITYRSNSDGSAFVSLVFPVDADFSFVMVNSR